MKVYTYSQARQNFSTVLNEAEKEEVLIKRKGGQIFCISVKSTAPSSPFDIPSVKTKANTLDIMKAIKSSRST
jgi:hypothetical protein